MKNMAKRKCHICGRKNKEEIVSCVNCGANLANPAEEAVVFTTPGVLIRSAMKSFQGTFILTNLRFFAVNLSSSNYGGGLVGAAISAGVAAGEQGFNVPLAAIVAIEKPAKGLAKRLTVITSDGNSHKLGLNKQKKWEEILAPYIRIV